MTGGRVTA